MNLICYKGHSCMPIGDFEANFCPECSIGVPPVFETESFWVNMATLFTRKGGVEKPLHASVKITPKGVMWTELLGGSKHYATGEIKEDNYLAGGNDFLFTHPKNHMVTDDDVLKPIYAYRDKCFAIMSSPQNPTEEVEAKKLRKELLEINEYLGIDIAGNDPATLLAPFHDKVQERVQACDPRYRENEINLYHFYLSQSNLGRLHIRMLMAYDRVYVRGMGEDDDCNRKIKSRTVPR